MNNTNEQTPSTQPLPPTQSSQTAPPSNSSWLKTLSIGFSIISFGITLAIIGYIVLTTKQNQTANQKQISVSPTISAVSPAPNGVGANWKTYRKDEYGFEIKYHPSWGTGATEGPDYTKEHILSWDFFNNEELYAQLRQTSNQKECLPTLAFIIYRPDRKFDDEYYLEKLVETKDIQGAPMNVYKSGGNSYCGYNYAGIINLKNGNTFFVGLGQIKDKKAIENLFDQILSTFRFTTP